MHAKAATLAAMLMLTTLALPVAGQAPGPQQLELSQPVQVSALAVALTESGQRVGSSATISVAVASGGAGHVFIETRPLAGTDMQGSARIAARVASAVTGYALDQHDFFVSVRSPSPIIAGPSAGAIMTAAMVVAIENLHLDPGEEPWAIDQKVMATGTVSPDGSVGPVGGILEKAEAAENAGADLFLVPEGQGTFTPREVRGGLLVEGEPVDVGETCRNEIGLECLEVGTIEALVRYMTGREFLREPVRDVPTTAEYNATMAPLSSQLIEDARAFHDVWEDLNRSDVSPTARQTTLASIEQAQTFVQQADDHWARQEYYSAASRAFSASIHASHAQLLYDYFVSGRSLDVVEESIGEARTSVLAAERAAGESEITGMHTLYTVGAAQERVSDAESRLEAAWASVNNSDLNEALFNVAWALERAETVHWWLSLSEPFGPGPEVPVEVSQLADEFIQLSGEMLAYAGSVLQVQEGPPRAAEQLARARADDRRGFHAAALVEAAEAQVIAALALEIQTGTITQDKVNASREEAARAIQDARTRGVEPVLAVAMYEFAGAQEEGSVALEFYRTARVYAGFTSVLTAGEEPAPSRFVGNYEPPTPTGHALPAEAYRSVAVGWLAIGVFSTLALAVLVMALTSRE
ncbi:MAG: S16 family serine protease [Candidatus Thermoplasmatota archaeon]|nr:S16 family serine protease [Candidatus Thermoplasmatota archaeon]